jgi:DHA1 family tetracycline resistance protein-like MFS transporter
MRTTGSNVTASTRQQAGPARVTILFLLFTAFLNVVGITIVFPVLPFIVQRYLSNPGALATVVGGLTASYALCQFIAAPGLGVLSDRFGRRPLLLICLLGSVLGYLLFGIGGGLWVLFLGRIIDGLTGGNFSILAAYIGDVTRPEERGKLFGQIGGVGGVGMIIGPAIGGFAARFGYSAPLYLAAAVMLATTIWGFFAMPESLQQKHRTAQFHLAELNPLKQIRNIFAMARLRWLLLTSICYALPFVMFSTELAVLAVDKLHWMPENIGLVMLFIGCIDIVMQGFLSGKLIPRLGEIRLTFAGLICEALGFVLVGAIGLVPQPALMWGGILLIAAGSGLLEPSLNALISTAAGSRDQGAVQGGNEALHALINVAGPLLAGLLYVQFGGEAPYWLGAAILLLGLVSTVFAAQHLDLHPSVARLELAEN